MVEQTKPDMNKPRVDNITTTAPGQMFRRCCCWLYLQVLFLATVTVTAHELINTTCGVNEFLFSGEEGVA